MEMEMEGGDVSSLWSVCCFFRKKSLCWTSSPSSSLVLQHDSLFYSETHFSGRVGTSTFLSNSSLVSKMLPAFYLWDAEWVFSRKDTRCRLWLMADEGFISVSVWETQILLFSFNSGELWQAHLQRRPTILSSVDQNRGSYRSLLAMLHHVLLFKP